MSSPATFSRNLRRECTRYDSIAFVCKKAKVNRQQFNKYLAGSSMPSAAVLQRICMALEIDVNVLFKPAVISPNSSKAFFEMQMHELTNGIFGSAIRKYQGKTELRAGSYYCYFPANGVPGSLVRSFLIVREDSGLSTFTRSTRLRSVKQGEVTIAKGRHRGIVLSNGNEIYLLGVNRYSPFQLSMMTIDSNFTANANHYFGTISTRIGNSQLSSNFCLIPVPRTISMRQILGEIGIVPESELLSVSLLLSSSMNKD